MDKMTLEKLEYFTQHAEGVESEIGRPLFLANYVTEPESNSIYSDMNVAISPNGSVVVKSNWDRSVHLLKAASNGKFDTRWSYETGDAIHQHLAVANNGNIILKAYGINIGHEKTSDAGVYVVCYEEISVDGNFFGKEKWRHLLSSDGHHPSGEHIRSPIITNDTVYIMYESDSDGHSCMCALNNDDGRVKWIKNYPGLFLGQPVLSGSNGFFVSFRKHDEKYKSIYGILELSGQGEFIRNIDADNKNENLSVFSVGSGGDIYALAGRVLTNGALAKLILYKFNMSGGIIKKEPLMTFPEDQEYTANALIIGPDDTLYIPTISPAPQPQHAPAGEFWNSKMWAIDRHGKKVWQNDIYGYVVSTPVITEEGSLYLSCLRNATQHDAQSWMTTGEVHALEVKSGSHRWITSIKGVESFTDKVSIHPMLTAPVLGLDGTVFIGAEITEKISHPTDTPENLPTHSCLIALRAHEQLSARAAWPIEHGNAGCSGISPLRPV